MNNISTQKLNQPLNFPHHLLRNDQDSTKHMCLFYLAGIIGTGVELEDYFYLLCKTLGYDKTKVIFYYSTYMTVTQSKLFANADMLNDASYERWINERKRHCSSTRTSTCENLCKRKAYRDLNIPFYACQLCKLSSSYQNSRDPLERLMMRYFMDASTPASIIYSCHFSSGFVSVERISPNFYSFGQYPIVRIYNFIYEFLLSKPSALELRADKHLFNDAVTTYICNHIDLSTYPKKDVSLTMITSRIHGMLQSLWNNDISILQSTGDDCLINMCIRHLSVPYSPTHEGKQTNPHVVTRRRSLDNKESISSGYQLDLFDFAATSMTDADFIGSDECAARKIPVQNHALSNVDVPILHNPNAEESSAPSVIDDAGFSDEAYAVFLQNEHEPVHAHAASDCACENANVNPENTDASGALYSDIESNSITPISSNNSNSTTYDLHRIRSLSAALATYSTQMVYLGQLLPDVSLPYRFFVVMPPTVFNSCSDSAIIRVTDRCHMDLLHDCVASEYVLLSPAIVHDMDEGFLIYTSNRQCPFFFSLIAHDIAELDSLLCGCNHIYTADTLGCMNIFVKYGSSLAHAAIISMDLYAMLKFGAISRSQLYTMDAFAGGDSSPYSMPISAYHKFCFIEKTLRDVNFSDALIADMSKLQTAYRVLFQQNYASSIIGDSLPLIAFNNDFSIEFLFRKGYRFACAGTVYTILFRNNIQILGDLRDKVLLPDMLEFLELMPRRFYHLLRLVHCDTRSISLFIGSFGLDAELFYDMLYQGLERCLITHGQCSADTVTVRVEYV